MRGVDVCILLERKKERRGRKGGRERKRSSGVICDRKQEDFGMKLLLL